MHGITRFEQGVDHTCDVAALRWFCWRFPNLELRRFLACRDWPYVVPHHIVEMEGNAHAFVNLGIITRQLIPGPIFRTRHTRQLKVRRLKKQRIAVSMLIWADAPLSEAHPLASFCPTRWPIVEDMGVKRGLGHLKLVERSAGGAVTI